MSESTVIHPLQQAVGVLEWHWRTLPEDTQLLFKEQASGLIASLESVCSIHSSLDEQNSMPGSSADDSVVLYPGGTEETRLRPKKLKDIWDGKGDEDDPYDPGSPSEAKRLRNLYWDDDE